MHWLELLVVSDYAPKISLKSESARKNLNIDNIHTYLYKRLLKLIEIKILTRPKILMVTATSFDRVKLSWELLGKTAARNRVNKLDVDPTTPASVCDKAIWNV